MLTPFNAVPNKSLVDVLFVCQEIYPYLSESTPLREFNRYLPEYCRTQGCDVRIFMPKFGEINERRNQVHEVIRLSGVNVVVNDLDHSLLVKVASIMSAKMLVYFIDNEEFFHKRKGTVDTKGKDYADNDERCIFFARGVIETLRKVRWKPQVIYCSGWMSALIPFYVRTAFSQDPYFMDTKIVVGLDTNTFSKSFSTQFGNKLLVPSISKTDVRSIAGLPIQCEDLLRFAIEYSDAVVVNDPKVNQRLLNYTENNNKILLPYCDLDKQKYLDLFLQLKG